MRTLILYLYTILAYIVLYIFIFLCSITILLLHYLGFRKAIVRVIRFWAKGTFTIIGKLYHVEGEENIDKNRKYILMANHASLFDIMGIMAIYPNVSWFGRAHLLNIPVFGKLLKAINYIPMKSSDLKNTKLMIEKLIENTKNQTVAIFPEGTRTVDGKLNTFRKGFLHVLKASKLDILPVSLQGFYEFKPKNRFYFNYPKKLSAKIHQAISFDELEKLSDKEIIELVRSKIESAI